MREVIKRNQYASSAKLIKELNRVNRRWTNYHRRTNPSKTFHRCDHILYCDGGEALCSRTDLKDTHASHIQPVVSMYLCHANEHGIAGGATDDRPHPVHVDSERTYGIGCATAHAGCLGERHIKGKDRLQNAPGSVAIQFVLHHVSPVGPKRSVLTHAGSSPRVTRLAATVSTNGVGPLTN